MLYFNKFTIFFVIIVSSVYLYNYTFNPFDYMYAPSPYLRNIGVHKPILYRCLSSHEPFNAYACEYYSTRLAYEIDYLFDKNQSIVISLGQHLKIGLPICVEPTTENHVYQYTFCTNSHRYLIQETPNYFGGYNYAICRCNKYGEMERSYYIGVFDNEKRLHRFFKTQQPIYWFNRLKKN